MNSTEIKRRINQSPTLNEWMVIFCTFSCLLCAVRVIITGNPTYIFLVWNLFLAVIPFGISNWLYFKRGHAIPRWKLLLLLLCWLLFIPNSFYILTDLFHLPRFGGVPRWFDLLLLLSFACNGLLLGIISLRKIELVLENRRGKRLSLLFVIGVMWLIAIGIYLGRYLRFNSWDILVNPLAILRETAYIVFNPLDNLSVWGMVMGYTAFMSLMYIMIKELGKSLFKANENRQAEDPHPSTLISHHTTNYIQNHIN